HRLALVGGYPRAAAALQERGGDIMIVPDGLLPCELLGGGHQCKPTRTGLYYACSECGRTSAPIRVLQAVDKAMQLPEKLRQIAFALTTSSDAEPPFFLSGVSGSHFDILPGLGRTRKDHPCEMKFQQHEGEQANITLRWGTLCPFAREAHVV